MSESEFNDYNEVIYERDKLKEQNEKLKAALIGIKSHIDFCSDEAWSKSLQSSEDYKVMSETLKSCES